MLSLKTGFRSLAFKTKLNSKLVKFAQIKELPQHCINSMQNVYKSYLLCIV